MKLVRIPAVCLLLGFLSLAFLPDAIAAKKKCSFTKNQFGHWITNCEAFSNKEINNLKNTTVKVTLPNLKFSYVDTEISGADVDIYAEISNDSSEDVGAFDVDVNVRTYLADSSDNRSQRTYLTKNVSRLAGGKSIYMYLGTFSIPNRAYDHMVIIDAIVDPPYYGGVIPETEELDNESSLYCQYYGDGPGQGRSRSPAYGRCGY